MRKGFLIGIVVILAVGIAGLAAFRLFQAPIGLALAERVVKARMAQDVVAELPDGLHFGVCGSGSPMADPTRAGPCLVVIAGTRIFVVDSGSGSTRNIMLMGVPVGRTEAVFLTHFHSDHIADLGELMLQRWASAANTAPVPVYGPPGTGSVVQGFNAAYRLDTAYRIAHHGTSIMPPGGAGGKAVETALPDGESASAVVIDDDDLRVTMFRVAHGPVDPAVGYRFDYRGRSLVISGDTSYTDSMLAHAAGADVLAHEALQPAMVSILTRTAHALGDDNIAGITEDILNYHASPEDAARIARKANVRALVFYHMIPPLPSRLLYPAFLGNAGEEFDGPITVSEDFMMWSLPAGEPDVITRLEP